MLPTVQNDHLNDVLTSIAAMQMTVACPYAQGNKAILHAYAYMPYMTESGECPFFVNRVQGGAVNFQTTMGTQRIPSQIDMALCVMRDEAASNLEEAEAEVLRWRTPVLVTFAAHIRLGGSFPWLQEASIVKYVPFKDFVYCEKHYLASIFTLSVIELFPITIGI